MTEGGGGRWTDDEKQKTDDSGPRTNLKSKVVRGKGFIYRGGRKIKSVSENKLIDALTRELETFRL